jgi:hypothetical protein
VLFRSLEEGPPQRGAFGGMRIGRGNRLTVSRYVTLIKAMSDRVLSSG